MKYDEVNARVVVSQFLCEHVLARVSQIMCKCVGLCVHVRVHSRVKIEFLTKDLLPTGDP